MSKAMFLLYPHFVIIFGNDADSSFSLASLLRRSILSINSCQTSSLVSLNRILMKHCQHKILDVHQWLPSTHWYVVGTNFLYYSTFDICTCTAVLLSNETWLVSLNILEIILPHPYCARLAKMIYPFVLFLKQNCSLVQVPEPSCAS